MIDLHMHTKYSDGTDECIEILKKAEKKQLSYISITDHNNCDAYNELSKIDIKKFYSGKIITGIELNTKILGIPIEILGYGINPKKMNELTKKNYVSNAERNQIEVERLYEKCLKEGIILEDDFIKNYNPEMYASKYLHHFITKNSNNKKLIDQESWENSNIFYRKYMSNPSTIFFVDTSDILPDFDKATNLIKEAGGLVFVPHIYEYRDNAEPILKEIMRKNCIDGIECYYTTFSNEQHENLMKICRSEKIFMSGGSDYHGKFKKDVDMGSGKGNLEIPEKIIEPWIKKVCNVF